MSAQNENGRFVQSRNVHFDGLKVADNSAQRLARHHAHMIFSFEGVSVWFTGGDCRIVRRIVGVKSLSVAWERRTNKEYFSGVGNGRFYSRGVCRTEANNLQIAAWPAI